MKDKQGRFYAKEGEVKPGDRLQVDGGFTCMELESYVIVEQDHDGDLFVRCEEGQHSLSGQLNGENGCGFYIGMYPVK